MCVETSNGAAKAPVIPKAVSAINTAAQEMYRHGLLNADRPGYAGFWRALSELLEHHVALTSKHMPDNPGGTVCGCLDCMSTDVLKVAEAYNAARGCEDEDGQLVINGDMDTARRFLAGGAGAL